MPRKKLQRKICFPPLMIGFKPFGIKKKDFPIVKLTFDEYESLKLLDYDLLTQEQASERMNISRPTLTRIYENARRIVAQAFVEAKVIVIEGGNVQFEHDWYRCKKCHKLIKGVENHIQCPSCPKFGNDELQKLID